MRLLGIDYGSKRIGLALSDEHGTLAFPHSVIQTSGRAVALVAEVIKKENVGTVVIGKSIDYKGAPNPILEAALSFAEELGKLVTIPILFETEILTTKQAERIQGRTELVDASAAAIILQSHIDRMKNK